MNEKINLKAIPLKELVKLVLRETPVIQSSETQLSQKLKSKSIEGKEIQITEKQREVMRQRAEEKRNSRAKRYIERDKVLTSDEKRLELLIKKLKQEGKNNKL
jgi:hypothetical protein